MNYEDWIPVYPGIDDPLFQTKLASKVEFQEVKSTLDEPAPTKAGDLFKYQVFDKRFMRIYDRLLMFYEAGTGKTCGYISVAEDYHMADTKRINVLSDAMIEYYNTYQGQIKNVIVILKGPTLRDEFKKQLVCKCTPGTYITKSIIDAKKDKDQKSAVTKSANQWYELYTYYEFMTMFEEKEKLSDEEIATYFNGTLFICDEIHTIKTDFIVNKKKAEYKDIDNQYTPVKAADTKQRSYRKIYEALWRCFHLPRWCKVILATATPMINDTSDLIDPMNLLLPETKQINKNTDLKNWPLEMFKEYMMGYVSFIRTGDTGVDTVFVGETLDKQFLRPSDNTLDNSQLVVEKFKMSTFQSEHYLREFDEENSGVRVSERQAAAFVFPDGTYGGKFPRLMDDEEKQAGAFGMGTWIESVTKDVYKPTAAFREATNSINKIRKLSCLYAAIIEQCMNAPGKCFIYEELLNGSGAIALAMCFESMGFARFSEYESVFKGKKSRRIPPYCEEKGELREMTIDPANRYGMIAAETSDLKDDKFKELFNSDENKNGEYCKIFIGSRLTRDGLNLTGVQDVFLPSMWTPSGMYQAMQRAIRATSHITLLKDLPPGSRIEVRVHRMAAYTVRPEDGTIVSVDLDMYAMSERKDRDIAIVRRKVREIAADCILQQDRNQKESSDMDYTSICDYDVCNFPCANPDPTPEEMDISTFNLFYSENISRTILEDMAYIFTQVSHMSVNEFVEEYDHELSTTALTIANAVQNKTFFKNIFGDLCTINIQGDYVYLVLPSTNNNSSLLDNYYASVLLINEKMNLNDFVAGRTNAKVVVQEGGVASVNVSVAIVEAALLKQKMRDEEDITEDEANALQRFKNYIYEINEPIDKLEEEKQIRLGKGKGRGRKASATKITFAKDPLGPEVEVGEEVMIIHTMYTIPPDTPRYAISAKFFNPEGRLRILDGDEWRDMMQDEVKVYHGIILGRIDEKMKPYDESRLYGSILTDGDFRIHDYNLEQKSEKDKEDKRFKSRGRICNDSSIEYLILIAFRLKIKLPPLEQEFQNLTKQEMLDELALTVELRNKMNNVVGLNIDEITYIYTWIKTKVNNRNNICKRLEDAFRDRNLLLESYLA